MNFFLKIKGSIINNIPLVPKITPNIMKFTFGFNTEVDFSGDCGLYFISNASPIFYNLQIRLNRCIYFLLHCIHIKYHI